MTLVQVLRALDCVIIETIRTQMLAEYDTGGEGSKQSAQGTKSASGAGSKASMSGLWEVMLSYLGHALPQPAQNPPCNNAESR